MSDDVITRFVYVFGVWEPDISLWTAGHLRHGDVVVDIGANSGYFSLLAAQAVGPEGRVVAVEPVKTNFDRLNQNLDLNQLSNVRAVQAVAGPETGMVEVYCPTNGNRGDASTVQAEGHESDGLVISLPVDDILSDCDIEKVRLVKVDTEGDELNVLLGMTSLLSRMPLQSAVIVEISPEMLAHRNQRSSEVVDLLTSLGFDMYRIRNSYDPKRYATWTGQVQIEGMSIECCDNSVAGDFVFFKVRTPSVGSASRSS